MSTDNRKAIRDSETFWQLEGESELYAVTIPDPPKAGVASTVRLTHSNSYGPFDEAEFFVRVGDPDKPTDQDDLDSATDWIQARLVEELVTVDDEEMLRSEAHEPFEDETPWEGTYDAQLVIPAGRRSIEVKIVSLHPESARVPRLDGLGHLRWIVMGCLPNKSLQLTRRPIGRFGVFPPLRLYCVQSVHLRAGN